MRPNIMCTLTSSLSDVCRGGLRCGDDDDDGDDDDAAAAAEGVCMAVHGYLRAVGQLGRYSRDDVLEHLDACIDQETTTRVFVSRYLTQVYIDRVKSSVVTMRCRARWRTLCGSAWNIGKILFPLFVRSLPYFGWCSEKRDNIKHCVDMA